MYVYIYICILNIIFVQYKKSMNSRVRFSGRCLLEYASFIRTRMETPGKVGDSELRLTIFALSCFFPQVLFTKRETSQVGVPRSSHKSKAVKSL